MSWFIRTIVDLFNALANFYYSRKYAAIAESMGLEESHVNAQKRGFIILQIDGLAYDHLREAMAKGYAPYMKRLLEKKALRPPFTSTFKQSGLSANDVARDRDQGAALKLARWRCGLPSATPAAQAGIMFGNNFDIPAFRWYEKESNTSIVCKLPGTIKAIQNRISIDRRGILRGGSSYVNMFDGDARLSLFTLSAMNSQHFFENVRGVGFLLLFLLSPLRVLRVIVLSLWGYLIDLGKRFIALMSPGYHRPFSVLSPFLQIMTNVVFREIQTFGCLIDIYRGMPAIYTNYYSYDEVAHHFRVGSTEALRALRGIDKQIKQIDRMRTQYQKRQYDLYILADHGLTPSIPFKKAYGRTLGQYITEQIGEGVFTDERSGEERPSAAKALFLLEELKGIESRLSKRGASLVKAAYRFVGKRLVVHDEDTSWDLSKRGDIVVRNSGSLSHIYFNVTPRSMNLSEIALIYPELLNRLVEHEGIGLVVGREEGEAVIVGKDGTLTLPPLPPFPPTLGGQGGGGNGGRIEIRGQDPLCSLPEPNLAANQLRQLASFPHSGDIIVFGAWREDGDVVCFENQVASHGGLGGPQDYPFIMYPSELDLDLEEVTNAKDLYPHFEAYLASEERGNNEE